MATLTNNSTGDFTTAATWSLVNSVSLLNSETGTTNSPTTFTNSSSFTPGAITIDGIGLKVSTRSASPTGTVSIRLVTGGGVAGTTTGTAVTGTTVTINISDISVSPSGWVFFKFSSPVLLLAATAYNVQVQSSTLAQLGIYRDGTVSNWSRYLRTTTTQAPVAADVLFVCGEYTGVGANSSLTVTMNNTAATNFGAIEINGKGILSYGTAASTNYILYLEGNLVVNGGGTFEIGTSLTPIPSSSSAILKFILTINIQYGLTGRGSHVITTYGATKVGRAYLNADLAIAATSLTTDTSTSWSSGDNIVIASTTRTNSETELSVLSANASGTTVSVTPVAASTISSNSVANPTVVTTSTSHNLITGQAVVITGSNSTPTLNGTRIVTVLSATTFTVAVNVTVAGSAGTVTPQIGFAHSGVSPTRAEIINLTRNVKIIGESVSLQTYTFNDAVGTQSHAYTEFQYFGSSTANRTGIEVNTITGTFTMVGCSIRNCEVGTARGINIGSASVNNVSITDSVGFRFAAGFFNGAATTGAAMTCSDCWAFVSVAASPLFNVPNNNGTFSNLVAAGGTNNGMTFSGLDLVSTFSFTNSSAHSNAVIGISLTNVTSIDSTPATISNITTWRNTTRGLQLSNCVNLKVDTVTSFGNAISGIVLLGSTLCADILFKNLVLNAGTTLTQPVGIEFNGNSVGIIFENSSMGATTTHSTGDVSVATTKTHILASFRNCLFSSATEVANTTNLFPDSYIGSDVHNQVVGTSKAWSKTGTITKDLVIYDTLGTGSTSMRITPSSSTIKVFTPDKRVIIPSGKTLKVSVKVRKSVAGDGTAYNGNFPRLIQRKNPCVGMTTDTVLATATAASVGAFETISGITAAATDNGVLYFYVDLDGTTGWVNVDTWSVEVI